MIPPQQNQIQVDRVVALQPDGVRDVLKILSIGLSQRGFEITVAGGARAPQPQYVCPVCGFGRCELPPTDYSICGSCGTEFGYDNRILTLAQLREEWIRGGCQWFDAKEPKPPGWDAYCETLKILAGGARAPQPQSDRDVMHWAQAIVCEVRDIRDNGQPEGLTAAQAVALTLHEMLAGGARAPQHPTCSTCAHLTPFDLNDDLFTCPIVNIRLHRDSTTVFGCNQHDAALAAPQVSPSPSVASAAGCQPSVPNGGDSGAFQSEAGGARAPQWQPDLEAQRDKLLVALKCCVDSAVPNPKEHPTMWKAWKLAGQVIKSVEAAEAASGAGPSPPHEAKK